MNIDYLIELLSNKLNSLILAKDHAFMSGDLERINAIDTEMNGVRDTLYQLRLLNGTAKAAEAVNASVSTIISAGVDAVQNSGVNTSATSCLSEYDITSYATDPLHEQSIKAILEKMGFMDSAEKIDAYIKNVNAKSPVTGAMVIASTDKYVVDSRLTIALMEQDSAFGTLGVGARTFNPGNVGNTGEETRTYISWEDGVDAVAEWLNRHRIIKTISENKVTNATTTPVTDATSTVTSTIPIVLPTSTVTSTIPIISPVPFATTSTSTVATTTEPGFFENLFSSNTPTSTPVEATSTSASTPTEAMNTSTPPVATSTDDSTSH